MSEAATKLIAAVLELPEDERVAVRDAIDSSFGDEDRALEAELERRWQGFQSGERPGVTAEELAREVRARYGKPA